MWSRRPLPRPPARLPALLRLAGRRVNHDSGHGLGLSIVRAIAAAHGAAINAHARCDGGLSIEVTFPAIPHEPSPAGTRLHGVRPSAKSRP